MIGRDSRCAVFAAVLMLPFASDADAQAVSLHGGMRAYDEGDRATGSVRADLPLLGPMLAEVSYSLADAQPDAVRSPTDLLEAQLQVEIPLGPLRPYVGAGVGTARTYYFGQEDEDLQRVYSLGAGLRLAVTERVGLVVDARMRDFGDEVDDDHTDLSVGIRYLLRRPDGPRFRGAPRQPLDAT